MAVHSDGSDERFSEVFKILVRAGADLDHGDDGGRTALFIAAGHTRNFRLNLLLEAGAARDLADDFGWPPLFIDAWADNEQAIHDLLAAGASMDAARQSVLHMVVSSADSFQTHYLALAPIFIQEGADIDRLDSEQLTPLMYAARNDHLDFVELLLEAGADPHIKGQDGVSAEELARQLGHAEIEQRLHQAVNGENQAVVLDTPKYP